MTTNETKEDRAMVRTAAQERMADIAMDTKGVSIRNVPDALKVCELIVASKLGPRTMDTVSKVFIAIQTGAEANLGVMASLRSVVVIEGTPSWKGDAVLALIRNARVCRLLTVGNDGEGDDRRGFVRFDRVDTEGDPVTVAFSIADARRAGLAGKGVWAKYPDDMLMWRAVSRAGKRYFSDVLLGMDVAEVVHEYAKPAALPPTGADLPPAQDNPPADADPLLAGMDAALDLAKVDDPAAPVVVDVTPDTPTTPPVVDDTPPHDPETGEVIDPPADPPAPDVAVPDDPPIADWEVHLRRGDSVETTTVAARTKADAGALAAKRGWRIVQCTRVGDPPEQDLKF